MTTVAVVVGKLEVMLTQALAEILRVRDHVETLRSDVQENAASIVDLRGEIGKEVVDLRGRIKVLEDDRSRRPTWPVIVTVVIGLVTLAVALGFVRTVNGR